MIRLPLPDADLRDHSRWTLPAATAHYATRVHRLGAGAAVVLFDGRGHEVNATLAVEGTQWFAVRVDETRVGRVGAPVTLVWAVPKGARLDDVTRQVTELGVARLLLLETQRGVVRLKGDRADKRRARLDRIAAEAARQCGRADVLSVAGPVSLEDALAATDDGGRIILHPDAGDTMETIECTAPVAVFVGPEGGFTPSELTLAESAGARRCTLTSPVLRTETAAVVGCALVLHRLGAL